MSNDGNSSLRKSTRGEARRAGWIAQHPRRSYLSVFSESRMAFIGMLVVVGSSSLAFLYSLFDSSGWRKALIVLGIGCAATLLFFLMAKYIVYSYRKDREREQGPFHRDHIIR
jgi:hypothetical protein